MLRKFGLAVILAMTTALAGLSAPGAASASDKAPVAPGPGITYWVEKNPPPPSKEALQAAAEMRNSVTPFASGGGCMNTLGVGVCISWTNNQLKGDFYVNSWSGVSSSGTARVYINVNSTSYYKYTVVTDHTGKYPTALHNTAAGSSGGAYTIVDTYRQNGTFLGGGISPLQYWP